MTKIHTHTHTHSNLAPSYSLIYSFNSGLKQAVERLTEREMDSLRCSRKKGYFLHPTGQAKDPPGKETLYIQPDPFLESLKKTVLFSTCLVVSVCGHFQRSVIKKAGNFPQIFSPPLLWADCLWTEEIERVV